MNPEEREKLIHIGRQFRIPGQFHDGHRIKIGHINETFAATYQTPNALFRVVHQTINTLMRSVSQFRSCTTWCA